MKVIIICGPSGSGKTTISKQILKKNKHGIILNTDNYYKTGFLSNILSKLVPCYYDKKISFNLKLFKRDLDFNLKHCSSLYSYKYDFKNKSIKKIYGEKNNLRYIIIEGIFGQELLKFSSTNNCILIRLKTNKQTCIKRAIKRDFLERGKSKNIAKIDFQRAWKQFHKNNKKIKKKSSNFFKKFIIKNETDQKLLIKKIVNLLN